MKTNMQKGVTTAAVVTTVVVIIILAIVVYAINDNDMNTDRVNVNNTNTGTNTNVPEMITFSLSEQNDSNQSGTATISEVNGRARVMINLTGSSTSAAQPAHIHTNSCANIGAVVYPLTNVVNGSSVTMLDVPVSQIFSSLPLSINVHKSATESNVYVACGDIVVTNR
jgi:hypothetical protein